MNEMIKLFYIGTDDCDRPVYQDALGKIWKDVNLGSGIPYIHNSSPNCFDGEPDSPINVAFEIVDEADSILFHEDKFRYQLLDRMRGDCEYYLGYGNRHPKYLWACTEKEHIEAMEALWHSFSDYEKPEWLTWEQICTYKNKML